MKTQNCSKTDGKNNIAYNVRSIGEEAELYYKIKIEIQMFNQAQQFNSSTSTAFLPMLCYMLCF